MKNTALQTCLAAGTLAYTLLVIAYAFGLIRTRIQVALFACHFRIL